MIILIAGASHTGKTLLAQRLCRENGCDFILLEDTYEIGLEEMLK